MKLPADDPRRRYILVVDGKEKPAAPWSTVNTMAKHFIDLGSTVEIKKRQEEE